MRRLTLFFVIGVFLAGCGPVNSTGDLPPKATPSPTPFQAAEASATPTTLMAWRSPALPDELAGSLDSMEQVAGRRLQWVDDSQVAEVRFGPQPDTPITQWVYAVAAAFATLDDQVALESLQASINGNGEWRLLMDPTTQAAWQVGWGSAEELSVPSNGLLAAVESASEPSLGLLPVGELSPRWKVLSVDGHSPFSPNFDVDSYPLVLSFGVSGPPELRQAALAKLDWAQSNFHPEELSTVAITGVTALTRATAWAIAREGVDWATELVAPTLSNADITHISHEVAFTRTCPPVNPSRDISRFCGQPDQIEVLELVGTDVVELTGNHVNDYGPQALIETLDMYEQRGWHTFGGGRNLEAANQPVILEHNGHRFVFLGCNNPGPNFAWATADAAGALPCDLEIFFEQIADLKSQGYIPIVTFQWAESYSDWPLPAQAEAFRQAAEAGAVVVSGSQAHRPQGFEFTPEGFIHFGLGNLFFDQMWSLETRQEFIDLYHFYQGNLVSIELTTWMLEDYARVRPMTEDERRQFLADIYQASGY